MQAPTLSAEALIKLTNRTQAAAQARILAALGINFKRHPFDGKVITTEDAVKSAFELTTLANSQVGSVNPNGPKWTRSL